MDENCLRCCKRSLFFQWMGSSTHVSLNGLLHSQHSFEFSESMLLGQLCVNKSLKKNICFDILVLFPGIESLWGFCAFFFFPLGKSLLGSFIISYGLLCLSFFTDVLCYFTSKPVALSSPERCSKGFVWNWRAT